MDDAGSDACLLSCERWCAYDEELLRRQERGAGTCLPLPRPLSQPLSAQAHSTHARAAHDDTTAPACAPSASPSVAPPLCEPRRAAPGAAAREARKLLPPNPSTHPPRVLPTFLSHIRPMPARFHEDSDSPSTTSTSSSSFHLVFDTTLHSSPPPPSAPLRQILCAL